MQTFLIYDDQPEVCAELKEILQRLTAPGVVEICTACTLPEAQLLLENRNFSTLFLDIELEQSQNGIRFAQQLQKRLPELSLVYITAHIRYCEEIFVTKPDAFLLKPFQEDSVRRVLRLLDEKQTKHAFLRLQTSRNSIEQISLGSISCIETLHRRLTFYNQEGSKVHEFYGMKLSDIEKQLPVCFCRCHQSICVNLHFVSRICRYAFTLQNGKQIPISQSRFQETKQHYLTFLGGNL